MNKLLSYALTLSIITIIYNLVEGVASIYFGASNETLALFGFGADSFVEVISGVGILHMILRMRFSEINNRDSFERTALKITSFSFYLLALGLVVGVVFNMMNDIKPETTIAGIIIATISLVAMYWLMNEKLKTGKSLKSDAIISDAKCTKTCFYLSVVLLASSAAYELFNAAYFDSLGSTGIAIFAMKEGNEAREKAKSNKLTCSCEE